MSAASDTKTAKGITLTLAVPYEDPQGKSYKPDSTITLTNDDAGRAEAYRLVRYGIARQEG